jgi:hypothetical protein
MPVKKRYSPSLLSAERLFQFKLGFIVVSGEVAFGSTVRMIFSGLVVVHSTVPGADKV